MDEWHVGEPLTGRQRRSSRYSLYKIYQQWCKSFYIHPALTAENDNRQTL
ncbi:MAG: hypothetical protein IJF83_13845 [Methanobrevibacter sp.]|nr:hypothetical protein [Methanobrevibacter sp.]